MAPRPKQAFTKVSLLQDVAQRPGWYARDLAGCGALYFSLGNVAYSAFLGGVAGVTLGPAAAFAVQGAIAAYTAGRQVRATYDGKDFGAPYRVQAFVNWGTAGIFLATGLAAGGSTMAMMVMPALTLGLWGFAHWNIANNLNRVDALKARGVADDAIERDADALTYKKRRIIAGGGADIFSLFKDKPVNEVAAIVMDPLARQHILALAALPFFVAGVWKSLVPHTPLITPACAAAERAAIGIMPRSLRRAFNLQHQGITSSHLYAAGYMLNAALCWHQPLFALAMAAWSYGYLLLEKEDRVKPVSAAEYGARIAAPGASAAKP